MAPSDRPLKSRFPGREIQSRISKDEKKFYLDKLRAAAERGDSAAMAKIVELGSRKLIPEDLVNITIDGKKETLMRR